MGPLPVLGSQPSVEVRPKLLQTAVQLLPEEQAVAFVLQGLVEPFADAIGLWMMALVLGWSMSSTARYSWSAWCSGFPQYSVRRSVRIRFSLNPCSSK